MRLRWPAPRGSTSTGRGGSSFRGGTMALGAAGVRVSILPPHRLTPYVVAGVAAGTSKPAVNDAFPDRVTNQVRALFAGLGVHAPLGRHLAVFADARMQLGGERGEALVVAPLRAGLRWHF